MIKQSYELSLLLKGELNKIKRKSKTQDQEIILLDNLLEKIKDTRQIINKIKKEKDQLIKDYISNTKPPNVLEIHKLTYKAFLMHFRNTFINHKIELDFSIYEKDNKLDSSKLKKFFPQNKMPLKVYLTNFPHLIGIKKNFLGSANKVIEYILYDFELIDDFLKDGTETDIKKLETFSWIKTTLYTPSFIVNKKSIIAENFSSDLVFIKKILYPKNYNKKRKYSYHLVGLEYIEREEEKYFVIKSQFPLKSRDNLIKKIDLENEDNILFKYKKVK
jgi:hypothetical protein